MDIISELLDNIKNSPYEELTLVAPHTGVVTFAAVEEGGVAHGPQGQWKEKPGTLLATIERERNPKPITAPKKGIICGINHSLHGQFVEAGTPLITLRHYLTASEVESLIMQKALYVFRAPERAKYYFTPEIDGKIRASGCRSVNVHEGMELFIMSRMKREAPLNYSGPEGAIYAVFFKHTDNIDAGQPLVGVCPPSQLNAIQNVLMRVQTEWDEKE